jgi:hypothetical protein
VLFPASLVGLRLVKGLYPVFTRGINYVDLSLV